MFGCLASRQIHIFVGNWLKIPMESIRTPISREFSIVSVEDLRSSPVLPVVVQQREETGTCQYLHLWNELDSPGVNGGQGLHWLEVSLPLRKNIALCICPSMAFRGPMFATFSVWADEFTAWLIGILSNFRKRGGG